VVLLLLVVLGLKKINLKIQLMLCWTLHWNYITKRFSKSKKICTLFKIQIKFYGRNYLKTKLFEVNDSTIYLNHKSAINLNLEISSLFSIIIQKFVYKYIIILIILLSGDRCTLPQQQNLKIDNFHRHL
jgi:hypothetical protein